MAGMQLRNIPDELMEKIRKRAEEERRSLNSQVLVLLDGAFQTDEKKLTMQELLEKASEMRESLRKKKGRFPSSVGLIHRMRAERSR